VGCVYDVCVCEYVICMLCKTMWCMYVGCVCVCVCVCDSLALWRLVTNNLSLSTSSSERAAGRHFLPYTFPAETHDH